MLARYFMFIQVYFHKTKENQNVDIEEYLIGVVSAEMPPSFNIEALKAQAVAARTFIINKSTTIDDNHKDAVVCTDSAHCKAYITEEEAKERVRIIKDTLKYAKKNDDSKVIFINGFEILPKKNFKDYFIDDRHPIDSGMELLGKKICDVIKRIEKND